MATWNRDDSDLTIGVGIGSTTIGSNVTLSANEIDISSGDFLIDVAGILTLDSGSGNILLKDDTASFGRLNNSSGNLLIKSGATTALTFSGANATIAGSLTVSGGIANSGTISSGTWSGTALVADKVPNQDNLYGFVANEHIDWTADSAGTIHSSNYSNTQLTDEQVQDKVGAMFSGNTETNITAVYQDSDGTIDLTAEIGASDIAGFKTEEEIQDIVGAMFTSNTETRVSATYQDGDGTIDLVVDDMTADTNTQNTTVLSFVDSSDDIILRNTTSGATVGTDDIKFVAGSNITLTHTDADNITIASADTNTTYTGGTNLTLDGTTFNVDDAFVKNNADDTIAGTLTIDKNSDSTSAASTTGFFVDVDKTGNVSTGLDYVNVATINVSTTGASGGDINTTGLSLICTGDTGGTSTVNGINIATSGADTNNGLYINNKDGVGNDFKNASSIDTGDFFSINTTTHGKTTLATIDDDASVAHLILDADGQIHIDSVNSAGAITDGTLFKTSGTTFGSITTHHALSCFSLFEAGGSSTDDYFEIQVDAAGATTLNTVDEAASAGHLTLDADGNVVIDSATNSITFKNNGTTRLTVNDNVTADAGFIAGNTIISDANIQHDGDDVVNFASNGVVHIPNRFHISQQSSAGADRANEGQVWVKNNSTTDLFFTNDDGTDIKLTNSNSIAGRFFLKTGFYYATSIKKWLPLAQGEYDQTTYPVDYAIDNAHFIVPYNMKINTIYVNHMRQNNSQAQPGNTDIQLYKNGTSYSSNVTVDINGSGYDAVNVAVVYPFDFSGETNTYSAGEVLAVSLAPTSSAYYFSVTICGEYT